MPKRQIARLLVTVAMVSLGGCKLLGIEHVASAAPSRVAPGEIGQAAKYGPVTQRGRYLLQNNMIGQAIDSFNVALASGEDPAAAYNGLGVAYARLGRADLGYRFFKKAIMSDPANPTYAQNLVRLVNSPEFTLNLLQRTPLPEAAQSDAQTAEVVDRAARVPGKLYREHSREFSLVTLPPGGESMEKAQHNAVADGCARTTGRTLRRGCEPVRLPRVGSRAGRSPSVALAEPTAPTQATASPSGSSSGDPAKTKAKAKVIDLTSPVQPGAAAQEPESDRPATATSAT